MMPLIDRNNLLVEVHNDLAKQGFRCKSWCDTGSVIVEVRARYGQEGLRVQECFSFVGLSIDQVTERKVLAFMRLAYTAGKLWRLQEAKAKPKPR